MENNGSGNMEDIKAMLNLVAADHVLFLERHKQFEQDHQMLLRAQVVMQDTLQQLAVSQKNTDERLNALIAVADGWIRANPRSAAQ